MNNPAESPICDVCGNSDVYGVCSMPGVPVSFAYCRECWAADAHPYNMVVANTVIAGGYDATAPWWKELVDHTLSYLDISMEKFLADVAKDITEFNANGW